MFVTVDVHQDKTFGRRRVADCVVVINFTAKSGNGGHMGTSRMIS
jgi:hypothetical protein